MEALSAEPPAYAFWAFKQRAKAKWHGDASEVFGDLNAMCMVAECGKVLNVALAKQLLTHERRVIACVRAEDYTRSCYVDVETPIED